MTASHLAIIYARSRNHCIGRDGGLPWSLPDEFQHFTDTTMGYPIIMGRRSFEDHEGVLEGRLNIVVTSKAEAYTPLKDLKFVANLDEAIQTARLKDERYFVIGGRGLIEQAMPLASEVFETVVDSDIEGDTYLPAFPFTAFTGWQTEVLGEHDADARHDYSFKMLRHTRDVSE